MKQGFTLIELIVVVIIMMLLLGVTLVSYTTYNDRQKVKQAAFTLKSNLQMARTNASSGNKPLSCTGETLVGYTVSFTASSYAIVPQCSISGEIIGEEIEVTLPVGITFSPVPTPQTFTYYPLTWGVSDGPSQVTVTNGSYPVTVVLDTTPGPAPTATATPVTTATSTPTATATPTPTATPSPTPISCTQHCQDIYGDIGICKDVVNCSPPDHITVVSECISQSKICCCRGQ